MATISDIIEDFIISVIGEDTTVQLSRNELANYFNVAPSQINYVLTTRFGVDKGFVIQSKRGGGGGITLVRVSTNRQELLPTILHNLDQVRELTYNKACEILARLSYDGTITKQEEDLIKTCISDKALATPLGVANIRKNIFREVIIGLMRR